MRSTVPTEQRDERVRPLVVTIDGPAGAGKSTAARMLARRLEYFLLDTGALYRACAAHLLWWGVSPDAQRVPEAALDALDIRVEPQSASMKVFLGDEDVSDRIRIEAISSAASRFSAKTEVRSALLEIQRSAAAGGGVVAEGRDMGTVVFPDADVKFFLTADIEERSRRRYAELVERGEEASLGEVRRDMEARDRRDEERSAAPLVPASDAVIVNSSHLDAESVVEFMAGVVARALASSAWSE